MNHWLDRIPRTMRDWLLLAAGVCLIALGVSLLPEALSGAGTVLGILAPFAFGVMLAYVLEKAQEHTIVNDESGMYSWETGSDEAEWKLLPRAVSLFCEGRLKIEDDRVTIMD